jgi:RHS repeat-associated protein
MGGLYVPKTREQFAYDLDGNLLSDGRWNYTWDAENRLVAMTNNAGVGPLYGLTFTYDAKGRRIQKNVTTNGAFFTTLNFAYDGWNPIAILNSQSAILTAFTWGSDLSGSIQGAGGVGGLVSLSYRGTTTTNCFAAFDGNGNLAALVNAADGSLVASYEYGPFGEVIRATGPMAKTNPIRFSTKYQDDESDLLYYGYRYYKASTGTWLSSDPINEIGFKILTRRAKFVDRSQEENLYSFVSNDSVGKFDILGLSAADVKAITDAYWKLFDEMCKSKKCCPEKGWIQNMPWSSTLGCTKQTQTVQDMLGNLLPTLMSGDSWVPEVAYKPLGNGNDPGPHNYSIMGSDNPGDPVITLDTWHGCLITYTRDSTIAGDKGTTDDWKQWTSDPPGTEHPHYDMHKDCRRCDGKSNPPDPVLPPVGQPPWGLH